MTHNSIVRRVRWSVRVLAVSAVPLGGRACTSHPLTQPFPEPEQETDLYISVSPIRQLDLIFMIDSSPSMAPKQDKLKAQFPKLVDALRDPNDQTLPDLRVAIINSDLGAGGAWPSGSCGPKQLSDGQSLSTLSRLPSSRVLRRWCRLRSAISSDISASSRHTPPHAVPSFLPTPSQRPPSRTSRPTSRPTFPGQSFSEKHLGSRSSARSATANSASSRSSRPSPSPRRSSRRCTLSLGDLGPARPAPAPRGFAAPVANGDPGASSRPPSTPTTRRHQRRR